VSLLSSGVKGLLILAVFALASIGAGGVFAAEAEGTGGTSLHMLRLRHASNVSSNWSGYVASASDVAATSFATVAGRWVQPKVSCTSGRQSASAFWVGLGGSSETSQALEQIGTEADCNASGKTTYSMWYELVPAASVPIKLKVLPGNVITASVAVQGTKVTVQIRNVSRRTKFTKVLRMSSPDTSSAEWVAEAPSACNSRGRCVVLPLTNFGTVSFTQATAIGNAHHGTISDPAWMAAPIELVSDPPVARRTGSTALDNAVPSALSPDGTSFTVAYQTVSAS
jgi:peptidase A4-like protein